MGGGYRARAEAMLQPNMHSAHGKTGGIVVNLLSTCCQPVVQRHRVGLPIVTYLINFLHLLGHVLPGAGQVWVGLDVRSLRHG